MCSHPMVRGIRYARIAGRRIPNKSILPYAGQGHLNDKTLDSLQFVHQIPSTTVVTDFAGRLIDLLGATPSTA